MPSREHTDYDSNSQTFKVTPEYVAFMKILAGESGEELASQASKALKKAVTQGAKNHVEDFPGAEYKSTNTTSMGDNSDTSRRTTTADKIESKVTRNDFDILKKYATKGRGAFEWMRYLLPGVLTKPTITENSLSTYITQEIMSASKTFCKDNTSVTVEKGKEFGTINPRQGLIHASEAVTNGIDARKQAIKAQEAMRQQAALDRKAAQPTSRVPRGRRRNPDTAPSSTKSQP